MAGNRVLRSMSFVLFPFGQPKQCDAHAVGLSGCVQDWGADGPSPRFVLDTSFYGDEPRPGSRTLLNEPWVDLQTVPNELAPEAEACEVPARCARSSDG